MTCALVDQRLDAYLEGTLADQESVELEAHVAGCLACQADLDGLRLVLEDARGLRRAIDPPRNLWPKIAARLPTRPITARARRRWVPLAAAAILLVVVTALVTYTFSPRTTVVARSSARPAPPTLGFASDREYVLAADDLERVLRSGEGRLAPATVEVIERNLALIDAAIAESRAALAADPANADLRALLWAAHRQKLDLLDRATRLTRS